MQSPPEGVLDALIEAAAAQVGALESELEKAKAAQAWLESLSGSETSANQVEEKPEPKRRLGRPKKTAPQAPETPETPSNPAAAEVSAPAATPAPEPQASAQSGADGFDVTPNPYAPPPADFNPFG
jgi:hypothetical protein